MIKDVSLPKNTKHLWI